MRIGCILLILALYVYATSTKPLSLPSSVILYKHVQPRIHKHLLAKNSHQTSAFLNAVADGIYNAFKRFTMLKIFNRIQLNIQHKTKRHNQTTLLRYPVDKALNHYFLG